jgi:uncharacterized phage-associated protein
MASVDDVAAKIVELSGGTVDTFKLQKLTYYSQAWHLVWESEALFDDPIEAWAAGPVIRRLYDHHKGRFVITGWEWGDSSNLSPEEAGTIESVVSAYGRLSGRALSDLTHSEAPWRDARKGLGPTDRSMTVIEQDAIYAFYSPLDHENTGVPISELVALDTAQ